MEGNLSRANLVRKVKQPQQAKRRRSSLVDGAQKAGWELHRSMERLERIVTDDRFTANREEVAYRLRSHLKNAMETAQIILDVFDRAGS